MPFDGHTISPELRILGGLLEFFEKARHPARQDENLSHARHPPASSRRRTGIFQRLPLLWH
jgi:hypothetical protein